jgi:hypothetical protein
MSLAQSTEANLNAIALREESEDDSANEEGHIVEVESNEDDDDSDDELPERVDVPQKRKHTANHRPVSKSDRFFRLENIYLISFQGFMYPPWLPILMTTMSS